MTIEMTFIEASFLWIDLAIFLGLSMKLYQLLRE